MLLGVFAQRRERVCIETTVSVSINCIQLTDHTIKSIKSIKTIKIKVFC